MVVSEVSNSWDAMKKMLTVLACTAALSLPLHSAAQPEATPKFSQRTITDHPGRGTALTNIQKREIKEFLVSSPHLTSLVCTGTVTRNQTQSMHRATKQRAKLACEYAKSLKPELVTSENFKVSKVRSYNGRVILVGR